MWILLNIWHYRPRKNWHQSRGLRICLVYIAVWPRIQRTVRWVLRIVKIISNTWLSAVERSSVIPNRNTCIFMVHIISVSFFDNWHWLFVGSSRNSCIALTYLSTNAAVHCWASWTIQPLYPCCHQSWHTKQECRSVYMFTFPPIITCLRPEVTMADTENNSHVSEMCLCHFLSPTMVVKYSLFLGRPRTQTSRSSIH